MKASGFVSWAIRGAIAGAVGTAAMITTTWRSSGDNPNAVTRFVLVSRTTGIPAPTGADKTSIIAELPDDRPGSLLDLLEQFSTRGVNLSLIESRPIGDSLGRYRFVIDADASRDDVEALIAQSQKRSAVFDIVTNPTKVLVELA